VDGLKKSAAMATPGNGKEVGFRDTVYRHCGGCDDIRIQEANCKQNCEGLFMD
jgi:hypothetical protein